MSDVPRSCWKRYTLGALLALALGSAPARAQGWVLDVSAGGDSHDAIAASAGTHNAVLGVRHTRAPWLYLSGGVPLDQDGLPWAAAGVGGRLASAGSRLSLGVDLGGHGYGYRQRALDATGSGVTLEARPFVALARGPVRLEVGTGVLHHSAAQGAERVHRTLHDSGVRLTAHSALGASVRGEGRLVRAPEGDYRFLGLGVQLPLGAGEVWGSAGRWLEAEMDEPVWGVGGSIVLGERLQLHAALQQEGPDPLYWNTARRSWSIGLSHTLGARPAVATVPVIPAGDEGRVTLRLPASESASAPAVAGDFTGWEPVPMSRAGDDWVVTLRVPPGVHRYAFRRADGTWFVPDSVANRVDDGFGGVSAVLIVPETTSS